MPRLDKTERIPITVRLTPETLQAIKWVIENERRTQQDTLETAMMAYWRDAVKRRARKTGFGKDAGR